MFRNFLENKQGVVVMEKNTHRCLCFDIDGCLYEKGKERELQEKYEYPILLDFLAQNGFEFYDTEELREWIKRITTKHGVFAHDVAICKETGISFDKLLENVFYEIPISRVIRKDRELVRVMEELKDRNYTLTIFTERQDRVMAEDVLTALGLEIDLFDMVSTRKDRMDEGFKDPSKYNPKVYPTVFGKINSKEHHYFEDNPFYLEIARRSVGNNGYRLRTIFVNNNIKEIIKVYIENSSEYC